jgi:hypothetical protein
MGFLDAGVNVLIFVLHEGERVDPYMQALHFASVTFQIFVHITFFSH